MIELPKYIHEHALGLAPERFPIRVYDLPHLDERVRHLRECLPTSLELYAAVRDPAPGIVGTLTPRVSGFEVVSLRGLRAVRRESTDVRAELGGPGKTATEISRAVSARGPTTAIHVDSPGELRLGALCAERAGRQLDVLLRVDPSLAGDGDTVPSGTVPARGMDAASLVECAEILRTTARVRLRGFSAQLPPEPDPRAASHAVAALLEALRPWSAMFGIAHPRYVITGGGGALPPPVGGDDGTRAGFDWSRYGALLARLPATGETLGVTPMAPPESWCGWYLTRVLDLRHHHGRAFAVVAGGDQPIGIGAGADFALVPLDGVWTRPWPRPEVTAEPVTVTGRIGGADRVLAHEVRVDRLRHGDVVAFPLVTADTGDRATPPPPAHCLSG